MLYDDRDGETGEQSPAAGLRAGLLLPGPGSLRAPWGLGPVSVQGWGLLIRTPSPLDFLLSRG